MGNGSAGARNMCRSPCPTAGLLYTFVAGGDEDDIGSLPTAAVGTLSASHRDFSGDILRVEASGTGAAASGAVLVRAASAGQDVFEIKVRN